MSEQLDPEQTAALRKFFEARKNAGLWKKEAEAAREEVDLLFGSKTSQDNNFADADGNFVGRVRLVPGKKLDVKRLRAERPEIYAEFELETEQTRIEEPK